MNPKVLFKNGESLYVDLCWNTDLPRLMTRRAHSWAPLSPKVDPICQRTVAHNLKMAAGDVAGGAWSTESDPTQFSR